MLTGGVHVREDGEQGEVVADGAASRHAARRGNGEADQLDLPGPPQAAEKIGYVTCEFFMWGNTNLSQLGLLVRTPYPELGQRPDLGQRHLECVMPIASPDLRKWVCPSNRHWITLDVRAKVPIVGLMRATGCQHFRTSPALDGAVAKYPAYRPILQPNTSARFHLGACCSNHLR